MCILGKVRIVLCAQTQDLQIFKKFYMSLMNPKEFVHNTVYSV